MIIPHISSTVTDDVSGKCGLAMKFDWLKGSTVFFLFPISLTVSQFLWHLPVHTRLWRHQGEQCSHFWGICPQMGNFDYVWGKSGEMVILGEFWECLEKKFGVIEWNSSIFMNFIMSVSRMDEKMNDGYQLFVLAVDFTTVVFIGWYWSKLQSSK